MKDYITTSKQKSSTRHPLVNSLSSSKVTPGYKGYLNKIPDCVEPNFFKDERWIQAMQQEIQDLEENNTWQVVDVPNGMHTMGSKWIYKIKYKANGKVERFKARLVAKVYSQQEELDYHDTFSLVAINGNGQVCYCISYV